MHPRLSQVVACFLLTRALLATLSSQINIHNTVCANLNSSPLPLISAGKDKHQRHVAMGY